MQQQLEASRKRNKQVGTQGRCRSRGQAKGATGRGGACRGLEGQGCPGALKDALRCRRAKSTKTLGGATKPGPSTRQGALSSRCGEPVYLDPAPGTERLEKARPAGPLQLSGGSSEADARVAIVEHGVVGPQEDVALRKEAGGIGVKGGGACWVRRTGLGSRAVEGHTLPAPPGSQGWELVGKAGHRPGCSGRLLQAARWLQE